LAWQEFLFWSPNMRGNRWLRTLACLLCATIIGTVGVQLARAQDPAADGDLPDPAQVAAATHAQQHVDAALQAVQRMMQDSRLRPVLDQAKGVLIVPRYREGALFVGGHGGVGVLLARRNGGWTDPVFYRLGGVSLGLQMGGASGPIAMLLMSDKAVDRFRDNLSTWSLGGRAGLTVARFSDQKRHPTHLDVIVWSGVKGLFGGLAFSATDVTPDERANHAYYRSPVAPLQILVGAVTNPSAQDLRDALASPLAQN
jgi:SH3 domain-containing YSC84-like protein 1